MSVARTEPGARHGRDDAAMALAGTSAVAEIPPPTARPGAELRIAHADAGPHGERVRALRTELLLRLRHADNRTLAVVSCRAGEGRSRLAAELAIALSQTAAPTILVDADLRRPRQHKLFAAAGEGLAEALASAGPARLQGVHGLPHLALVTAGTPPAQPLELLSGLALAQLFAAWREEFEYVIVDTPPAAECSDALAVTALCGGVLLVSRRGRSRLDDMHELMRRLSITPARVLGCALNRF